MKAQWEQSEFSLELQFLLDKIEADETYIEPDETVSNASEYQTQ